MSASNFFSDTKDGSPFFKEMQEYGRNPDNGYMDDVYLKLIKEKQKIGKPLTQEEQEFLDNHS